MKASPRGPLDRDRRPALGRPARRVEPQPKLFLERRNERWPLRSATAAATSGGANVNSKSQAPANRPIDHLRLPETLNRTDSAGSCRPRLRPQQRWRPSASRTRRPGERARRIGSTPPETRSQRAVLPHLDEREHGTLSCLSMRLNDRSAGASAADGSSPPPRRRIATSCGCRRGRLGRAAGGLARAVRRVVAPATMRGLQPVQAMTSPEQTGDPRRADVSRRRLQREPTRDRGLASADDAVPQRQGTRATSPEPQDVTTGRGACPARDASQRRPAARARRAGPVHRR